MWWKACVTSLFGSKQKNVMRTASRGIVAPSPQYTSRMVIYFLKTLRSKKVPKKVMAVRILFRQTP